MSGRKLAYLCLQATTEGQASYAHVHEIIAGLKRRGWAVDLFEPGYAGGASPGVLGRLLEFRRVQHRLVRALRAGEYDAVYVRNHTLAWSASWAARRLGVPVIQECNGPYDDLYTMWPQVRPLRPLLDAMTRWQFRHAGAVIAVTPDLAAWIEAETGRPADVVGNGANIDVFRPDAPAPAGLELPERYAVFFGALSPWQEVPVLLEAERQPGWPEDVALVLAGDGALKPEVEAAARSSRRVRYLGSLSYSEVAGVVASSLCSFVLKSESYLTGLSPLKLYESMASGVPVIATDIPEVGPVVHQHACGIAIAHNTTADVTAALGSIAADPAGARAMGARGRAAVEERYSWDARAAATHAIVERAAGRR